MGVFEEMVHDLRLLLRLWQGRASEPKAGILDSRTLQSTPQSGARGGYDGAKPKKGSKVHAAVDTLGHPLALFVTPANEQERAWVGELAEAVQEASGESVDLAYVDQGHTGQRPAEEAQAHAISVEVVKHPESKHGFVLLPRRWVVERTNAWQNAHKKLVWCTERQGRVIDFWIAFSNTIIMGRLIREAWYRTTRDEPPLLFTEQFAALLSLYISTW